jgi:glycosyltransferase involved in cell wall biosynthesis
LRIIIAAENASSRFGGEAILPLHYFKRLRERKIEAWLVVHSRTRDELRETLSAEQDRIHYIEDTFLHRAIWRLSQFLPERVASNSTGLLLQALTQFFQRRLVKQLVKVHRATVVHQPIPVSPRAPSMLMNVGAPVIIGPMNGGMNFPPGFESYQSRFESLFLLLARQAAYLVNRAIPGKHRAAAILVANQRTRAALPLHKHPNIIELVENGVDLTLFNTGKTAAVKNSQRLRFVFVGRLIKLKALDLLLTAFSEARKTIDIELWIIGDGNEKNALQTQATNLGLDNHVSFHGFIPQHQTPEKLQACDALIFPSLHDCGGAVVLEAMAMGLPVIATRWGGPADYIDDECGILLDPSSPDQFIQEITKALIQMTQSSKLRQQFAAEARKRVEQFYNWERKIDRMLEIYQSVE